MFLNTQCISPNSLIDSVFVVLHCFLFVFIDFINKNPITKDLPRTVANYRLCVMRGQRSTKKLHIVACTFAPHYLLAQLILFPWNTYNLTLSKTNPKVLSEFLREIQIFEILPKKLTLRQIFTKLQRAVASLFIITESFAFGGRKVTTKR